MTASVLTAFGGPDVLRLAEVPTPTPGPGELLVRVHAAGTNRLDHYLRAGDVTREIPLPHILGSDVAGTVAALGDGAEGFAEGDRVVPMPGYPADQTDSFAPMSAAPSYGMTGMVRPGGYAEYLTVPARWAVRDETGLPFEEVATLPMVAVTAVRAVRTAGGVKAGDRVVIHAGASGTGSMAIQVAKALGATVLATARSDEKAETARAAGADHVVNVRDRGLVEAVLDWTDGRGADVVIDNIGGEVLQQSLDAVRPLGTVVALGFVAGVEATIHVQQMFFAQKRIVGTLMGDTDDLRWALSRVCSGEIKPVLDRALPLGDAAEAHRMMAAMSTRGTVVLVP